MIEAIASNDSQNLPIENYVNESMSHKNTRNFEYRLNEKSTKSKLIKSAKRVPFEIEENSTSSNLVFSLGAWYETVLPAIAFWNEVRGNKVCIINGYKIKIVGFKAGTERTNKQIDTQIIFLADTDKITCHFYNTTQKILVNGRGFRKFIDCFFGPFFQQRIDTLSDEISALNRTALEQMGEKSVKRSDVKFSCNSTALTDTALNKHKRPHHGENVVSISHPSSSTRNNSFSEALMLEDNTLEDTDTEIAETLEAPVHNSDNLQFRCLDDSFKTSKKVKLSSHLQIVHNAGNTSLAVDYTCGLCDITFVESDDYAKHLKSHERPEPGLSNNLPSIRFSPKSRLDLEMVPNLENHVETSRNMPENREISLPFKCNICQMSHNSELDLEWHFATNHEVNSSIVQENNVCQLCDFGAITVDELESHIIRCHAFKCERCDMIFQSMELLQVHRVSIHDNLTFKKCSLCDFESENESILSQHRNTMHSQNGVTLSCSQCEHIALSINDKEDHMQAKHSQNSVLEQVVLQQSVLSQAFSIFKEDLTAVLNKIFEDNNAIKQELFIIRQNDPNSKKLQAIDDRLQNISNVIQGTGLTSNQRPENEEYVPIVPEPGRKTRNSPQSGQLPVTKVSLIGDAIGCNLDLKVVENILDAKIKVTKSFSSVTDFTENEAKRATRAPEKCLQKVLNEPEFDTDTDILLVQTGSVDITNLKTNSRDPDRFSEYFRRHTVTAAENVFDEVSKTLTKHTKIKKAIILEQIPRHDLTHVDPYSTKAGLAKLYNETLYKKWLSSPIKERLLIGKHSLDCSIGAQEARFKNRQQNRYDGIHMYGPSGRKAYTESLMCILKDAGLVKRPPPTYFHMYSKSLSRQNLTPERSSFPENTMVPNTYTITTSNRFDVLSQGN